MPITTQELKRRREDAEADLHAARQAWAVEPNGRNEAVLIEAGRAVRRLTRKINQRRNR